MKEIKVMADYQCHPLWDMAPGMYGDIDPSSLPISSELKKRLFDWAHAFDETLDMNDPSSSGFKNAEAVEAFKKDGLELAESLQAELGAEYVVVHRIHGQTSYARK